MTVAYSPRGLRDLNTLLSYVDAQDPQTAERMAKAIQASLKRLALQPRLGSATSKPNVYRAPVKRYRIAIFYRTRRGQPGIQVVRIVRGTRVKNLNKIPRG